MRLRTLWRSYQWNESAAEEILEEQRYTCATCSQEAVDIYSPVHLGLGFVCAGCRYRWMWSLRDAARRGEYRGPARTLHAAPRGQATPAATAPPKARRRTGMPRLPGDAQ